jgi:hypothetical protein
MPRKKLHLYLSADCRCTADDVIDINIIEDPTYKVVSIKKTDLKKIQVCFTSKVSIPFIKRSRNHIPWEMELRMRRQRVTYHGQ